MNKTIGLKKARKISRKINKLLVKCSYMQIADKIQAKYGVKLGLATIESVVTYHMHMEWLALQAVVDNDDVLGYKAIPLPEKGYPCLECAINCSDIDCDTVPCTPDKRKDGRNVIFIKE